MTYLQPSDVAQLPGELKALWDSMSTEAQADILEQVDGEVNRITRQEGGLLAQRAKTKVFRIDRARDRLLLPNKPITTVWDILIQPRDGLPYHLPILINPVTALAAELTVPGAQTITPLSMAGISAGLTLTLDVGPAQETIGVAAVAAASFTANVAQPHPVGAPLLGQIVPSVQFGAGQSLIYTPPVYQSSGGAVPVATIPNWGRLDQPFAAGDTVLVTYDCGYPAAALPAALLTGAIHLAGWLALTRAQNPAGAHSMRQDRAMVQFAGRMGDANAILLAAEAALEPLTCFPGL